MFRSGLRVSEGFLYPECFSPGLDRELLDGPVRVDDHIDVFGKRLDGDDAAVFARPITNLLKFSVKILATAGGYVDKPSGEVSLIHRASVVAV